MASELVGMFWAAPPMDVALVGIEIDGHSGIVLCGCILGCGPSEPPNTVAFCSSKWVIFPFFRHKIPLSARALAYLCELA
jgi:hypothetical protein